MEEVMVRKAGLKDVAELVALSKAFMKEHYRAVSSINRAHAKHLELKKNPWGIIEEFFRKTIHSKNGVIHVAQADGRIVGYCLSKIKKFIPIFVVDRFGYICDLYVAREFRGRGISTALKDAAVMWMKGKGMKYASIEYVTSNRKAMSVYENWGFFNHRVDMRMKL